MRATSRSGPISAPCSSARPRRRACVTAKRELDKDIKTFEAQKAPPPVQVSRQERLQEFKRERQAQAAPSQTREHRGGREHER